MPGQRYGLLPFRCWVRYVGWVRTPSSGVGAPQSLRSSNLDEIRSFLDPHFNRSVTRLTDRRQAVTAQFDVISFGAITLSRGRFGAELDVSMPQLGAYHIAIPCSGWLRQRPEALNPLVTTPGDAVIYHPDEPVQDRWSNDCSVLGIKIEPTLLQTQLATMLDATIPSPLRLEPLMDLRQGPGLSWLRLVRVLADDCFHPAGLTRHPLLRKQLTEAVLAGLLMSAHHRHRDQLDRPSGAPVASRPVRRVIDAVQAFPEEPHTLATLAEIAGVSQRTLQAAFRRYVGTSPMRYLRDVRLSRAHDDLRSEESTTVASVAYTWGFNHLGRFAGLYRARYGVGPSEHQRDRRAR